LKLKPNHHWPQKQKKIVGHLLDICRTFVGRAMVHESPGLWWVNDSATLNGIRMWAWIHLDGGCYINFKILPDEILMALSWRELDICEEGRTSKESWQSAGWWVQILFQVQKTVKTQIGISPQW
jgi:hypothetical protein